MSRLIPQTEEDENLRRYDAENEHGANATAQISILAGSVIYLGMFAMVLMDVTRYSVGEFFVLFAFLRWRLR